MSNEDPSDELDGSLRAGIGARLFTIRKTWWDIGQFEMARRLDIPYRTYQSYERGTWPPKAHHLAALGNLGVNVNWVLTGHGDPMQPAVCVPADRDVAGSQHGLAGEPYRHEPGPPVPVEPPPPPAAPVVNDDLLVDLYHRVAALYLSERLPSSIEGELRNALALYNELVATHGPAGPPAQVIADRIKKFRDWLRKNREEILRGEG